MGAKIKNKIGLYLQIARPHQYLKNGFIWLPLFFGYKLRDFHAIAMTFQTFLVFCLLASSLYIYNDIRDIHEDRRHPTKKMRPLASGHLSLTEAAVTAIALLMIAILLAFVLLPVSVGCVLGAYLLLSVAYSTVLKHLAIVDVTCIALGFVLRIVAGGMAVDLAISHWIVLMTFLLALFLALAKRRDDLLLLSAGGDKTRHSLDGYNLEFVTSAMLIMASVIIVSYVLYTVSPGVIQKHGTDQLYLTSFWVVMGLLRFLQITIVHQRSGSPTRVLIKDGILQGIILMWLITYYLLLYRTA